MSQLQENNKATEPVDMIEKRKIIHWIKKHKKELIIAGISISALILIILGVKNRKKIQNLWKALKEIVKSSIPGNVSNCAKAVLKTPEKVYRDTCKSGRVSVPFEVSEHIRNLHAGWHASTEKIGAAKLNGIELEDGQTWVCSYWKGTNIA